MASIHFRFKWKIASFITKRLHETRCKLTEMRKRKKPDQQRQIGNALWKELRWFLNFRFAATSARAASVNVISFWQHFWTVLTRVSVCLRLFWRNDSSDQWAVYLHKRLEMPSNDVKLLRYRPRSELQASLSIRRTVSEDCLLNERDPRPGFSMLKLSKTRISVGDSVTVYWDIRDHCGANDWIGLFDLGKFGCIW